MDQEILLRTILDKLEKIERLLTTNQHGMSSPASFSPGGRDWFLIATEEERRAFNRQRGQASRRGKK